MKAEARASARRGFGWLRWLEPIDAAMKAEARASARFVG